MKSVYQDDNLLISDFRKGNQLAFRYIFDQLNKKIIAWCANKFTVSEQEAEDRISEAWHKLYIRREQIANKIGISSKACYKNRAMGIKKIKQYMAI